LFLDSSNFGRIAKKSRKKFKSIKVVTFFHNVEYLYALSVMKASGFFYLPSFMASWHNETLAVKFSNVIIAINERDRAVIEQKYHTAVSGLLPPCFPDYVIPENDKSALISKPLNVLFLGSWFHANIAGIKWFITKVLPFADIRLVIAGRGMEKIKEIFPLSNKLYVIGTMQNTEEIYRKADCVVNPVFIGSGMKIKTGEALRYGRTVVGTREAFTGYNITNGKEGFICETADDFILAFDKIMKNQKMRANIASYNYFREYLTVDAAKKNMTALICDKQ
jgi:glycosyltransferase involved in cell wall biosynthesis